MMLFLDATAPERVTVGLRRHRRWSVAERRIGARSSARVLAMVAAFLRAHRVPVDAVDALAVVQGPGTYSGIRTAVAFGNALRAARGVRLVALTAHEVPAFFRTPSRFPRVALLKPDYGRPPQITKRRPR